ncbi:MAG: glycosyl hydrolase 115 family protein [Colwellia sp.]
MSMFKSERFFQWFKSIIFLGAFIGIFACSLTCTYSYATNTVAIERAQTASENTKTYVITQKHKTTQLIIDKKADALILWAVNELAKDIHNITGSHVKIIGSGQALEQNNSQSINITIGQLKQLTQLRQFKTNQQLANHPIIKNKAKALSGAWEKFIISPDLNSSNNLYIIGSDVRGTVYGIFELAERLGISPWQWWADVNPISQELLTVELPSNGIIDAPSVQYRGIFLNDEDWGLQPWAAKTFETDVGDIGPKSYEKIFQLLLRLKANTIWPAMHPSTKSFYSIKGNQSMAQKYHIVVGTSHAEPMLRNNVDEWHHDTDGDYNYFTNSDTINQYWQARIDEVEDSSNQTMITMGMRGIHDSHMRGAKNTAESVNMLEKIITKQRQILTTTFNKPITEIPQVLIPYKEVLALYNQGLVVPDDISLMWTDDNYGYIRRLSNQQEQQRVGGAGVYYHLSYWGRPHDYLWLSTTQPGLIWFEMSRAYANGAQKIWIANVGDIKPNEYSMEFFLDLAWDINSVNPKNIKQHLSCWVAREFGQTIANKVADVINEYYRLAFLRKPEFMGWSQTEPTTKTQLTEFSTAQVLARISAYKSLVTSLELLVKQVPKNRLNAWYQLVEYPVKSAANMNYKFLYRQLALTASSAKEQDRYAKQSRQAYEKVKQLTEFYNIQLSDGKWQHMMSMKPRNLPVFKTPSFDKSLTSAEENQAKKQRQGNKSEPIYLQANAFSNSKSYKSTQWQAVEGLGYSDNAVTLMPLTQVEFVKDQPWLNYNFSVEEVGSYQLEIRLLPTHANNFDHQLSVSVNNKKLGVYSLNTTGRSKQWKENVLRNAQIITVPMEITKAGVQTVKLSVNQTGIVLDQLAIRANVQITSYEIPNIKH